MVPVSLTTPDVGGLLDAQTKPNVIYFPDPTDTVPVPVSRGTASPTLLRVVHAAAELHVLIPTKAVGGFDTIWFKVYIAT